MLARQTTLRHPSGIDVTTPLLIPSFSSKGFRIDANGISEIRGILDNTAEVITDVFLVSAYDIHHGFLPPPEKFTAIPEMVVVDSGGYETSDDHDFSAVFRHPIEVRDWDEDKYAAIINGWPSERVPATFVSYDRAGERMSFVEQVKRARRLFKNEHKNLHTFLLKPESRDQLYLTDAIKSVIARADEIGGFHIIGVTEKELGKTALERMTNIAKLRLAMDAQNLKIPIHVFGALDPLTSSLYLIAGAEIFDGLTWIRYAYYNGMCIYPSNFGAIAMGTGARDSHIYSKMVSDNYYQLLKLQESMKDFIATKDFDKLRPHEVLLKNAYDSLKREIGVK